MTCEHFGINPFALITPFISVLQHPISWLVREMDNILAEQKVVSCVSEKAKWWEGRRALDSQVEVHTEEHGLHWGPKQLLFIHLYSGAFMKIIGHKLYI